MCKLLFVCNHRLLFYNSTALGIRTTSSSTLDKPKKVQLSDMTIQRWFLHVIFDLFCGFFSFMILHCDDGIRHVEAVLEEPTNLTDSQIQIPLNTLPRPIFVTMFIKIYAQINGGNDFYLYWTKNIKHWNFKSTPNSTQLNSTGDYGRRCLTPLCPHHYQHNYIIKTL